MATATDPRTLRLVQRAPQAGVSAPSDPSKLRLVQPASAQPSDPSKLRMVQPAQPLGMNVPAADLVASGQQMRTRTPPASPAADRPRYTDAYEPLLAGVQSAGAGAYDIAANLYKGGAKLAEAMTPDFLRRDGEMEAAGQIGEEWLRDKAEKSRESAEAAMGGREDVLSKINYGVGQAAGDIPMYALAGKAAGPIAGMAAIDAAREAHHGTGAMAESAAHGAGLGLALTAMHPATRAMRTIAGAALGGSSAAAGGGDLSDVTAGGVLMGALAGAAPGGARIRDVQAVELRRQAQARHLTERKRLGMDKREALPEEWYQTLEEVTRMRERETFGEPERAGRLDAAGKRMHEQVARIQKRRAAEPMTEPVKASGREQQRDVGGWEELQAQFTRRAPEQMQGPPAESPVAQLVPAAEPVRVETPPPMQGPPAAVESRLPRELAGAKPRYSYRDKQLSLVFESDLDKAAYIAAQAKPSKRDADYVAWGTKAGGMTEQQLRAYGKTVRDRIKPLARDAEAGSTLTVPAGDGRLPVRSGERGGISIEMLTPKGWQKPAPPKTEAETLVDFYVGERAKAREPKDSLWSRIVGRAEGTKADLIDALAPIFDLIAKSQQVGKKARFNPETGEVEFTGSGAFGGPARWSILEWANPKHNIERRYRASAILAEMADRTGLVPAIAKMSKQQSQEFEVLAMALHRKQIAMRELAKEKTEYKPGFGETLEEAVSRSDTIIREMGPRYKNELESFRRYVDEVANYAVETKLVTPELMAKLRAENPYYVPLERILPEAEVRHGSGKAPASLAEQTVVQKRTEYGSDAAVQDVVGGMLKKGMDVILQGEANMAARNIVEISKQAPELNLARDIEGPALQRLQVAREKWRATKETAEQAKARAKLWGQIKEAREQARMRQGQQLADPQAEMARLRAENQQLQRLKQLEQEHAAAKQLQKKSDAARKEVRLALKNLAKVRQSMVGQPTISWIEDGVRRRALTTPEVERAVKAMDRVQLEAIGSFFHGITNVFKTMTTGARAAFLGRNIVRDLQTAMMNTPARKEMVRASLEMMKDPKSYAQIRQDWMRAGGGGGTYFEVNRNLPELTIDRIRSRGSKRAWLAYTVKNPTELYHTMLDYAGRLSEEPTRIAVFEGNRRRYTNMALEGHRREIDRLRKQGKTQEAEALEKRGLDKHKIEDINRRAADHSREDTANFFRMGNWGRAVQTWMPYLNASKEGVRAKIRSLRRDPSGLASTVVLMGWMPALFSTLWNYADPERRAAFADMDEETKRNNHIVILDPKRDEKGNYPGVIMTPISQEMVPEVDLVRAAIESMLRDDPVGVGQIAKNLLGTGVSAFSPIGNDAGDLLSSVVPQPAKGIAENLLNKDFYRMKPLVPPSMEDDQAKTQAYPWTTQTARALGSAAEKVGIEGGISPIKIENFIRKTFGAGALEYLTAAEKAAAFMGLLDPEATKHQTGPLDALGMAFTQARGGVLQGKDYEALRKVQGETKGARFEERRRGETLMKRLREDTDRFREDYRSGRISKADMEAMRKAWEWEKKGLEGVEKSLVNASLEERAKFIHQKIQGMKTPEERGQYVARMAEKKILNRKVMEHMLRLKAGEKGKDVQ